MSLVQGRTRLPLRVSCLAAVRRAVSSSAAMVCGMDPVSVAFRGFASIQLARPESSWTLVRASSRQAVVQGPPIGNGGTFAAGCGAGGRNGRRREARPRPPTRRPARSPAARAATVVVLRRWAAPVLRPLEPRSDQPLSVPDYQRRRPSPGPRRFCVASERQHLQKRPQEAVLYRFRYTDVTVAVIDQVLLEGAHRAIERWGWREATLERIATEAGVSRMTLHRRGVTRDGLLGRRSPSASRTPIERACGRR